MPPFLLPLLGVWPMIRTGWKLITSPPGLCILAGLAFLATFVAGQHSGDKRTAAIYERRIAESIENNAKFDENLRKEVAAKAEVQRAEADKRVAAAEGKVQEYEKLFKSCFVGDDGADFLNGDQRVRDGSGVISKPPVPPARPGRGSGAR